MKILTFVVMAFAYPLMALAGDLNAPQPDKYEAAREFTKVFLLKFAPNVQEAIKALDNKIREITTSSGEFHNNKNEKELFIENYPPDSEIVEALRKDQGPPLFRWEARGNYEYVKGGLEVNLTKDLGKNTEITLRGLVTQEFFQSFGPEYQVNTMFVCRF